MKKKLAIMLALALTSLAALTACGKKEEPKDTKSKTTASSNKQEADKGKENSVKSSTQEADKAPSTTSKPSADTQAPAPEYEEATLKVAYMPNYGSLWSVMNAIDQKFLDEQKLKVELVEFQDGPTIIAAMESGSIDIGYIGQGAHKLCINGKAKIFALSHISNGDALIGGEGITKVEDLKGKKVAYSSGTSSEDILKNSLQKVGMSMEDIEAVDMDASAIVTAMLSGSVDACATWSPNSIKILDESKGATKLTDNMTFSDTTVSLASWIVTPAYAEQNQELILRFTKALFKAMDYAANDHFEETAASIAKQVAQEQDVVFAQRGDAKWLTGQEVSAGAADGTVEKYYDLQKKKFQEAGAVEVDPPVSDYVMFDNMVQAGK